MAKQNGELSVAVDDCLVFRITYHLANWLFMCNYLRISCSILCLLQWMLGRSEFLSKRPGFALHSFEKYGSGKVIILTGLFSSPGYIFNYELNIMFYSKFFNELFLDGGMKMTYVLL